MHTESCFANLGFVPLAQCPRHYEVQCTFAGFRVLASSLGDCEYVLQAAGLLMWGISQSQGPYKCRVTQVIRFHAPTGFEPQVPVEASGVGVRLLPML